MIRFFDKYPKFSIRYELILCDSGSVKCPTTVCICTVADCVRFNFQTMDKFERVKSLAKCCNARHWVYTMLATGHFVFQI